MSNIEGRLRKLEAAAGPCLPTAHRFIANEGESADDCIRRHGFDPDDESHLFIVRLIASAPDHHARLAEAERIKALTKLH